MQMLASVFVFVFVCVCLSLTAVYLMNMGPETVSNPLPSKQFRVPLLCLRIGCDKCRV